MPIEFDLRSRLKYTRPKMTSVTFDKQFVLQSRLMDKMLQ